MFKLKGVTMLQRMFCQNSRNPVNALSTFTCQCPYSNFNHMTNNIKYLSKQNRIFQQTRKYKNFGHKVYPREKSSIFLIIAVIGFGITGFMTAIYGFETKSGEEEEEL